MVWRFVDQSGDRFDSHYTFVTTVLLFGKSKLTMLKIAISILLAVLCHSSFAKDKLILAYENRNNYPYYTGNGAEVNKPKPGVSVELIQLLEHQLEIEVEFQRHSWPDCKALLKQGKVDGIFNASFRHDRLAIGVYPMNGDAPIPGKRIDTISYVLYKHVSSDIGWDSISKKISNLTTPVYVPKGYSIASDLRAWGLDVLEKNHTSVDLKRLSLKEIQAIAALERAGDFYIRRDKSLVNSVEKVTPPLITKHYYLMLSHQFYKANPKLAHKIWDEIEVLRDKHLESILFRYFL